LLFSCREGDDKSFSPVVETTTKSSTSEDQGGIVARLIWKGSNSGYSRLSNEEIRFAAPAGVETVRTIVSGDDMTTIEMDFLAGANGGAILGIKSGTNRTLTIRGLDSNEITTHEATVSGITIATGQNTDAGIITMEDPNENLPVSGLVAYYPFNSSALDESNNGNDGTVNGATLTTDRFGNGNSAYSFDGNDYFIVNQAFINLTSARTFTGWFKFNTLSEQHFFCTDGATNGYTTIYMNNTGIIKSLVQDNANTGTPTYSDPISFNDTIDWHFVSMVWDGFTLKTYLDGTLQNTVNTSNTLFPYNSTDRLTVGVRPTDLGGYFLNGSADDIRIYNRALSESEIQQLYTLDSTEPTSNTFTIDSDAGSTDSNAVLLNLDASDEVGVSAYFASEINTVPDVTADEWISITNNMVYTDDVSFILSGASGDKTVYIWYRDLAGNISTVDSDTISLNDGYTTLTSNLIAYYPFNGNANDESGNGNHGTVSGAILAADRDDASSSAYSFDGNDNIAIPDYDIFSGTENFTVSLWAKHLDDNVERTFINFWHENEITCRYAGNPNWVNKVNCYVYIDSISYSVGGSISSDTWYQLVLTYTANTGIKAYINGTHVDSIIFTPPGNTDSEAGQYSYIGADRQNTHQHNGSLDDIRIYNRSISDAEVKALYQEDAPNYEWAEATPSANWSVKRGHGSVGFDGKLWVLGAGDPANNDVWNTTDGINWTEVTNEAEWGPRDYPASVAFAGKLWVMGGGLPGSNTPRKDVWSSSDGINWTMATDDAAFGPRSLHTSVVFKNKMWLMGGSSYPGSAASSKRDVWNSEDGITWTLVTDTAGWSIRAWPDAVVFDDKIWIMGGNADAGRMNDVWSSSDGANWTQTTADAGWPGRYEHSVFTFDNKLWVTGGSTGIGQYANDLWSSSDGIIWTQILATAGWESRGAARTANFDNKTWLTGGRNASGAYNDVWFLSSVIDVDTTPPANHSAFINDGDATTDSTSVTINLTAFDQQGVIGFYLSETDTTPDVSSDSWISITSTDNYTGQSSYTLSDASGDKIVYTWFKDAAGNISAKISDSINYVDDSIDLTLGLVAYYPLDGDANDESSNSNDGVLNGVDATTDHIGNAGKAYEFDGSSAYITLNSVADDFSPGDDFTFSGWIKSDSFQNSGMIFSSNTIDAGVIDSEENIINIIADNSGFRICISDGFPYACNSYEFDIYDGIWKYLTVRIGSDGTFQCNVNGIELTPNSSDASIAIPWSSSVRYSIGQEWDNASASNFFNGSIDNVRLYNRLLSNADIEALYAQESGMVLLDGGTFQMGDNTGNGVDIGDGDADELPVHSVSISPFYISDHEVTATEYKECVDAGGCTYTGGAGTNYTYDASGKENHPINYVSWIDTQDYVLWKNQSSGITYRLCSEAEWEYAARSGSTTKYSCGDNDSCLDDVAWYSSNSGNTTNSIKTKQANIWELYDLHGNVWEWVQDWWHSDYTGAPTNGSAWETPVDTYRVARGGDYGYPAAIQRSAKRAKILPNNQDNNVGFRLCGVKSRLPDTGQTTSYTTTFGEDHDYTINPPMYTVIDASADSDASNDVVIDNVTGLMWHRQDDNTTKSWSDASTDCQSSTMASYDDWRLPNVKELASILSFGGNRPTINDKFSSTSSSYYWSGNSYSGDSNSSFIVLFDGMNFDTYTAKTELHYSRCVRGNSYFSNDFVDNGNNSISDQNTGLMWQKTESGTLNWEQAISYCNDLTLAGNNDWRLPTIIELQHLMDFSTNQPAMDTTFFPNAGIYYNWSSTTIPFDSTRAYEINAGYGNITASLKASNYHNVRCVSSGQ